VHYVLSCVNHRHHCLYTAENTISCSFSWCFRCEIALLCRWSLNSKWKTRVTDYWCQSCWFLSLVVLNVLTFLLDISVSLPLLLQMFRIH